MSPQQTRDIEPTTLARRLRRRPNIDPTMVQYLVFAGSCVSGYTFSPLTVHMSFYRGEYSIPGGD